MVPYPSLVSPTNPTVAVVAASGALARRGPGQGRAGDQREQVKELPNKIPTMVNYSKTGFFIICP